MTKESMAIMIRSSKATAVPDHEKQLYPACQGTMYHTPLLQQKSALYYILE
jgi:hypothetical protein